MPCNVTIMVECYDFTSDVDSGRNIDFTPSNIQLCEVPCATELVDQFGYERKWVFVFYCHVIQHLIVLYKLKRAILLFNEEHRGSHGRF